MRRSFVQLGAASLASLAGCALPRGSAVPASTRAHPTAAQLLWRRDELAMFLHFGVNTFTDREWGDGRESPAIVDPARLDAMQWARAARDLAAGARRATGREGSVTLELPEARTIGYARLERFAPATVRRVRLSVDETVGTAGPVGVRLFGQRAPRGRSTAPAPLARRLILDEHDLVDHATLAHPAGALLVRRGQVEHREASAARLEPELARDPRPLLAGVEQLRGRARHCASQGIS